jgi:hypothetical protein
MEPLDDRTRHNWIVALFCTAAACFVAAATIYATVATMTAAGWLAVRALLVGGAACVLAIAVLALNHWRLQRQNPFVRDVMSDGRALENRFPTHSTEWDSDYYNEYKCWEGRLDYYFEKTPWLLDPFLSLGFTVDYANDPPTAAHMQRLRTSIHKQVTHLAIMADAPKYIAKG